MGHAIRESTSIAVKKQWYLGFSSVLSVQVGMCAFIRLITTISTLVWCAFVIALFEYALTKDCSSVKHLNTLEQSNGSPWGKTVPWEYLKKYWRSLGYLSVRRQDWWSYKNCFQILKVSLNRSRFSFVLERRAWNNGFELQNYTSVSGKEKF